MSSVDRAGRVTKIKKGQRSWGRVPARNSRENTIFITFAPTITLATLKAVSLQLNGMLNRFNQQQNELHLQDTFFSNQQRKQICTCSTLFVFLCCCFAQLQRCFVGLKRQTSQLHIIFMEELSYVLTQYFVSCVDLRFCFSLPLIFTLRAVSISHCLTAALKFHVFLPTTFVSFVFNHSLQLFLCYPRECKHQK